MKNGEIWSFEKQLLKMDTKDVWQLTAVNISELYQLYNNINPCSVKKQSPIGRHTTLSFIADFVSVLLS